jgi:hypothetical protein
VLRAVAAGLAEFWLAEVSSLMPAAEAVASTIIPSPIPSVTSSVCWLTWSTDCRSSNPHIGSAAGGLGSFAPSPELQWPAWPAQQAIVPFSGDAEAASGAKERKNESIRQTPTLALARVFARETNPTRFRFTGIIGLIIRGKEIVTPAGF